MGDRDIKTWWMGYVESGRGQGEMVKIGVCESRLRALLWVFGVYGWVDRDNVILPCSQCDATKKTEPLQET